MDKFTWGKVIDRLDFDGVDIVKYHPWRSKGITILTGSPDYAKISYDVVGQNETFTSFYHAVLGVMARKCLGINNGNVAYAMARALGCVDEGSCD